MWYVCMHITMDAKYSIQLVFQKALYGAQIHIWLLNQPSFTKFFYGIIISYLWLVCMTL